MLTGDEELTVDEVERLSEDTQSLVAGTPKEGNRRQAEVFERRYLASARGFRMTPAILSKDCPGSHWNSPFSFEVRSWMLPSS